MLASVIVSAQDPGSLKEESDLIFSRDHLSISIMGGMALKADVTAYPYKYQLGSSNRIAFGGGINYHCNFSRKLSLITGLHMVAPVRNMAYYIPKAEFDPRQSFIHAFCKWKLHGGGTGQPVINGNYSFKGSFVGLTGRYVYTGAKKRMRQLERKRK